MFVYIQNNPVKASIFAGALTGLVTTGMMAYLGFAMMPIALAATGTVLVSSGAFLTKFTDTISRVKEWLWPPQPVTIPRPENNQDLVKEREGLIKRLSQSEEMSIKDIRKALKRIFQLRSYSELTDQDFKDFTNDFEGKYLSFKQKIKTWNNWFNLTGIKARTRSLMVDAAIYSDTVLAKLEQQLRDEGKEVTTETVATLLTSTGLNRYYGLFLWSGIIELYHLARLHATIDHDKVQWQSQTPELTAFGQVFYDKETENNDMRKIYNCFLKKGFYQRYGEKAFENALCKRDKSYGSWTKPDSSKADNFSSNPCERPLFNSSFYR